MQNSVAKKIFAVGSAVAMTVSFLAPLAAHAAADPVGTNFSDSSGTVWMVMPDGTRRAYTSAGAFLSYGTNSWSSVVPGSAADLALPTGSFIPPQDGSIICSNKGSDMGTCYEISNGQKFGFTSAAVFTGLGFSFSNSMPGDVSWMPAGSMLINNATMAHLPGTLVNNNGTVELIGNGGYLGIPDLNTFNSWGYSFGKVVPANDADKAMTQTGVMAVRVPGELSPIAMNSTGTTPPPGSTVISGSVSASLSSDTPAAGTLVSSTVPITGTFYTGQVGADVAHFTFSGTGTVTQVVVNRIGVSSDSSLNNVYLFQGNNRISDAGTFSNGMVTFTNSSGLFTVQGTTEISVRYDVAGNVTGQTVGAELTSYTVANGSPASVAVSGNLFSIAGVNNLATVNVTGTANNPPHTGTNDVNAGTLNQTLWSYNVNVGQRAVLLKYIQFKQIGSISQSAIQNLHLYVDGTAVGPSASITSNGSNSNVVVFDMTGSPVTLNTGGHLIELHGDIVTGTSFTFDFSLQTAADAVFFDPNYNVNVQLTNVSAQLFQLAPGASQISSGTVSVQQDPTFTATQFVQNSSQVVLGSWTMKAYGEDVKVQSLEVSVALSGGSAVANEGFNNLSLFVNGGQVGSSQSALAAGTQGTLPASGYYTFGSGNLFTIPAGTTVTVQVKGDNVFTSSTYTSETTTLTVPASSFQGATSYSLTPSVATPYVGVSLSTSASNGTLAKNTAYSNQTVSSNITNQKIGSYVIQAGNADGVRLNGVTIGLSLSSTLNNNGTSTGQTINHITNGLANIYVVVAGSSASTTPQQPATTNNFGLNNVVIPANQTATVDVYADVSNATGTVVTTLYATAQGQNSLQTVTGTGWSSGSPVTGQTITVANGTVQTPTLQTSAPVSQFVIGGTSNQPAAVFNFVASSGGATIQELDFGVEAVGGAASSPVPVTAVTVNGVTSAVVGASSTVTGLSIPVPTTYGGIDVPVTVNYSTVGQNGIASNQVFQLVLQRVKFLSGSTTTYLPGVSTYGSLASSNAFDLVASAPTVSLAASGNTLGVGSVFVAKVTVTANSAGNIVLDTLPISMISSGASSTVAANNIIVVDDSTSVTASTSNTSFGFAAGGSATTTITFHNDNTVAANSSKTYDIYVPIAGVTGTSGNSSIAFQLGSATLFTFKDVNGNVDNIPGAAGGVTYIANYPTLQVSMHN